MIDYKYTAGFIDSDGSLQIHAKKFGDKFSVYPVVSISQLPHRSNLLHELAEYYDLTVHQNTRGSEEIRISGTKGRRLMEATKNHLVIKQELADYILNLPKFVCEEELKAIKSVIKSLRRNNTPCKPRASRKWAAGYIDGDGCISATASKRGLECRLSVSSWRYAQAGLVLLKETFGGYIVEHNDTANWRLSLTSQSKVQEVKEFIGRHLRIKKTQLELVYDFISKGKHLKRCGATDESLRAFCETLTTTKSISIREDDVIV